MENKLAYLKKYLKNPSIEKLSSIGGDAAKLPVEWINILSVDGEARIGRVLDLWRNIGDHVSEIYDKLKKSLVSLDLLKSEDGYSLLYGISGAGRVLYYEARNPLAKKFSDRVAGLWPNVPKKIRDFYEVHDGWYYLASHSLGLFPSRDVFLLADEDWAILDEIGDCPVVEEQTVVFFTNGASGYVCLDLSAADAESSAIIWWSIKSPIIGINFWNVVDSWTAIGIDN